MESPYAELAVLVEVPFWLCFASPDGSPEVDVPDLVIERAIGLADLPVWVIWETHRQDDDEEDLVRECVSQELSLALALACAQEMGAQVMVPAYEASVYVALYFGRVRDLRDQFEDDERDDDSGEIWLRR